MPVRKKKPSAAPETSARPCHVTGCGGRGAHKAPLGRERLSDYIWLCLDHVRAYNANWDFFDGMSQPEIEAFMHDALTGHRPTWKISDLAGRPTEQLREALERFRSGASGGRRPRDASPPASPKHRKALAILELDGTETWEQIKRHYRRLVKKYHPDLHCGDKRSEERFKVINAAYHTLKSQYKPLA